MNISDENICADFLSPLILSGLINFDWLPKAFDHVQYLNSVVSIFFGLELNEPVALMLIRDLVSGYMNIHYGPTLQKELPHEVLIHLRVQVAYIHCSLLVSFK